jgi:hypothetical protein
MKLIEKVKPEILKVLRDDNEIKYGSSYRAIILSLKNVERYRQLTIDQVDQLITFLPDKFHPNGRTDFYYGDYLLKNEEI